MAGLLTKPSHSQAQPKGSTTTFIPNITYPFGLAYYSVSIPPPSLTKWLPSSSYPALVVNLAYLVISPATAAERQSNLALATCISSSLIFYRAIAVLNFFQCRLSQTLSIFFDSTQLSTLPLYTRGYTKLRSGTAQTAGCYSERMEARSGTHWYGRLKDNMVRT